MSGGDKIQIVMQARDEVSDKVKTTKATIKSLEAQMSELNKELDRPGNAQKWEELRREHAQAKRDLIGLGKESASLKGKFDQMTKPAELGAARLSRSVTALTKKFGITGTAADRLRARMERLDAGAYRFKKQWSSAIDAVKHKMDTLRTKLSGINSSGLASMAKGGMLAAGAATAGLGLIGFNTASQLEQSQIALEQMLGSAKKAGDMMTWLKDTAAKTPFELSGLTQSTQRLLAFGFSAKDAQKNLMVIGDAAAATGKGQEGIDQITNALGQMQAKQKISGEEMLQLTEAGIPAWDILAKKMGTTVPQLQAMVESQGGAAKLFGEGGLPKLIDGMGDKYDGLMKKQSKTLGGLMSTLKDTVGLAAADLIKKYMPQIKRALKGLIDGVGKAFDWLKGVVDKVGPVLGKVFGFISDNKQVFIIAAGAIGVMTIAMMALNAVMAINPVTLIIMAIGALIGLLVLAYKKVGWFRNAVNAAFDWIKKAIAWFVDWFGKYAWPLIRTYLKLWWMYISKVVWPVLRTVFKAIAAVVRVLWRYISEVFWPKVRGAFRLFIGAARGIWNAVKDVWGKVVEKFHAAKERIAGILTGIKDGFKNLWNGLTDGLGSAIDTMKQWLSKIPGLSTLIDMLWTGGTVTVGRPTIVGELGPEMFVPNVGSPRMIGEHGPELTRFATPGVVIPNHLLAAAPAAPNVRVTVPDAGRWTGPAVQEMHVHGDPAAGIREAERMIAQRERVAAERRG